MRMFLNAIFDFKPKDKAFVTVPPILREVLKENAWVPKRFLFDLYDINEASSEGRTPHAMLKSDSRSSSLIGIIHLSILQI